MNLLSLLGKVGSMTMLSRILGFVRDMIIARVFGAGDATDAFFTAFKLPNLLRRIFAEGAFAQAFVPILAEYKQTKSPEATREFVRHIAGMLTFVLTIAPWIIHATATGFANKPDKLALSADLLRIMFPYILLISLSSFVGSILNTYHKFQIPAFTPVLLNLSFISFALFLVPYFDPPITALAWAVFVGGVLQLVFQLPWLAKQGFLNLPKLDFKNSAVNRVIKQMTPAVFAASVTQISLVINTIFASYLQSGSITWMYYADRMTELPTGAGSTANAGIDGAITLRNDAGMTAYFGPQPPAGHAPHRYLFAVDAVDVEKLDIDPNASPTVLSFNLHFHSLGRAILWGWDENP